MGATRSDAWWFRGAEGIADAVVLSARIPRLALTRPHDWHREFLEQCYFVIRRCTLPLALCAAFISFGTNVPTLGGIASVLGASDRLGAFAGIDALREFAAWVTGMVLAGIAGTAMCADIGARKIREELDAIAVLGIDHRRTLVLPRVLAVTAMAPFLYLWAVLFSVAVVYVLGPPLIHFTHASFDESFQTILAVDLFTGLLKVTLIGFVIGVISCVKGLGAKGGTEGVGRSVNQAVVVAFVATWVISLLFNAFVQSAFTSTQGVR